MGMRELLSGDRAPYQAIRSWKYKKDFKKAHPTYFDPEGLLVFCGPQGSGKTLSAVQYVRRVLAKYPKCIFCTNVSITGLPESVKVVEYEGVKSLTDLSNGYEGVLYLIDEIHLEFNSTESTSIPIEVMTEISQQRKQRKHIVGTSQVYGRMAKPLREQIRWAVSCKKILGFLQYNTLIDGSESKEVDGKLQESVVCHKIWLHTPELYGCYDTFAKMRRYSQIWKKPMGRRDYNDSRGC